MNFLEELKRLQLPLCHQGSDVDVENKKRRGLNKKKKKLTQPSNLCQESDVKYVIVIQNRRGFTKRDSEREFQR